MTRRPAEFSRATRDEAARRVNYRCSLPLCRRPTLGPSAAGGSVSTGEAAHIFSASPGGPRGDGGLPREDLASVENALWCCAMHARLIDSQQGANYSAGTLRRYRTLAEARAALEQGGVRTPSAGWFHDVVVRSSPIFQPGIRLTLGKTTALVGPNDVGKTALADTLVGLSDVRRWERWHERAGISPIEFAVRYFDPEPQEVAVTIESTRVARSRNGREEGLAALPVRVLRTSRLDTAAYPEQLLGERDDVVGHMAMVMGVARATLLAALPGAAGPLIGHVESPDQRSLGVRTAGPPAPRLRSYWLLSGTERHRLVLAIALSLARDSSIHGPMLLVVDDMSEAFDDDWRPQVLEALGDLDADFQVLVALLSLRGVPEDWHVVRLQHGPHGAGLEEYPL